MDAELIWIPETNNRGISDYEVAILANRDKRIILTRDRDFMKSSLRKRARYGVIYIGEPIRKDNVDRLASNIIKTLKTIDERPFLVIVTSNTIELYRLKP